MPNIEIKAKYSDLNKARRVASEMNACRDGLDVQVDTYFKVPGGRLKLRESTLCGAQLVPYIRPDQNGPKKSDYVVLPVDKAELTKRLFSEILGVETVVKKTREIFLIGNVRIHLDEVDGLGCFFEFEAVYSDDSEEAFQREQNKISILMEKFGIVADDLIQGSYREMMLSRI